MNPEFEWPIPKRFPTLAPNTIHIWRARLAYPETNLESWIQILSSQEQDRARQFKFEKHRHRFILSHGLLRILISQYLNIPPQNLTFDIGPHGKPELSASIHPHTIRFNMSHSRDLALYAVSWHHDVGIDVECIRPTTDALQIANRFFSQSECQIITACPPEQRQTQFFRIWTLKEAGLKAIGRGIPDLDRIRVWPDPDSNTARISIDPPPEFPQSRMFTNGITMIPDFHFVGALVYLGPQAIINCFQVACQ